MDVSQTLKTEDTVTFNTASLHWVGKLHGPEGRELGECMSHESSLGMTLDFGKIEMR